MAVDPVTYTTRMLRTKAKLSEDDMAALEAAQRVGEIKEQLYARAMATEEGRAALTKVFEATHDGDYCDQCGRAYDEEGAA